MSRSKLFYNYVEVDEEKTVSFVSGFVSGAVTAVGLTLIAAVGMVNQFPLQWAKLTWWLFTRG